MSNGLPCAVQTSGCTASSGFVNRQIGTLPMLQKFEADKLNHALFQRLLVSDRFSGSFEREFVVGQSRVPAGR
ncbi:MAG: hypothetical protein R3C12_21600 [Planctomycetaceae bacterium]